MQKDEVFQALISLNFDQKSLKKLQIFHDSIVRYNYNYNLISKTTVNNIWHRHILDSAQLVDHFDTKKAKIVADLGSGAGFPGIVLSIFSEIQKFHVKLYEKSPVKRQFLRNVIKELQLKAEVRNNVFEETIKADVIVCRAFKKLNEILNISRETIEKPHKVIILKGKSAHKEIKSVSLNNNTSYTLKDSITDKDSKILVFNVSK